MFAGLFGSSLGVKLAEKERAALSTIEAAGPFGAVERPMGGYPSLPSWFTAEEASRWVGKAGVRGDAARQEGVVTQESKK
jgi:hypothetical protein